MKTFADLKRALTVGRSITLTDAPAMPSHKYINVPRFIIKTQTNGVYLSTDKDSQKGSFMDLPRASLVDFDGDTISIYNVGERDLTEDEKRIMDNAPSRRPENKEACERDVMTDGSSMFYADRAYYKGLDAQYLEGFEVVRGLRFDFNRRKVNDEATKGTLQLKYKLS